MTLREFIQGLNDFVEENPETLDLEVITSDDPEGNGYSSIYYEPSKGIYENTDYISSDQYEDYEREDTETNAVCVN